MSTKERPILFSGPMVRAILEGRKTQTRRVVKQRPPAEAVDAGCMWAPSKPYDGEWSWLTSKNLEEARIVGDDFRCPYGQPGDRLWVRETWCSPEKNIVGYKADAEVGAWFGDGCGGRIWHRHGVLFESPAYESRFANGQLNTTHSINKYGRRWRPSIHMPRWASRITLEVVAVRVERLQAISDADAKAEGFFGCPSAIHDVPILGPTAHFADGWNHINGKGAWDANPWIWVVEFKRVEAKA